MTEYVGTVREHDGRLTAHYVLSIPLADQDVSIHHEIIECLYDLIPNDDMITTWKWWQSSGDNIGLFGYNIVTQWLDRVAECVVKYPSAVTDKLNEIRQDILSLNMR